MFTFTLAHRNPSSASTYPWSGLPGAEDIWTILSSTLGVLPVWVIWFGAIHIVPLLLQISSLLILMMTLKCERHLLVTCVTLHQGTIGVGMQQPWAWKSDWCPVCCSGSLLHSLVSLTSLLEYQMIVCHVVSLNKEFIPFSLAFSWLCIQIHSFDALGNWVASLASGAVTLQ
jgi:hypothetical protein